MGKCHFTLKKCMLIKLTITQLLMGLFEKLFRLHDPQTPLYQKISLFDTSHRARIEWVKRFSSLLSNIFQITVFI